VETPDEMEIYLPIAEMPVNVILILGLGGAVGFLSGLFGVGGGFLMTPLLILIGIPSPVAVATQANQIVALSVSGVLAHWQRGNVDFKMGMILTAGGFAGSSVGVWLFAILRSLGHIDLAIKLCYVVLLGGVGALMLVESARAMLRRRPPPSRHRAKRGWMEALPLKMRFRRSRLYISALSPAAIGFVIGLLAAILGTGGGFIMIPAMIYVLGMPTAVVVGTSLFQIIFVTANITVLQAVSTQTVDVVLAMILLVAGVVGTQFGVRAGARLRGDQLRGLLAVMVLVVAWFLVFGLARTPVDLYSVSPVR
jgi:uncharacterized membrane protein YfcA